MCVDNTRITSYCYCDCQNAALQRERDSLLQRVEVAEERAETYKLACEVRSFFRRDSRNERSQVHFQGASDL